MLLTLAIIVLILAVLGGFILHHLVFLLALVAVFLFVGHLRSA